MQVDGNIFVVYNMGTEDHPIGEVLSKVNDGTYHVVRFIRSGPNATVQVDDYEMKEKNPSGESCFRMSLLPSIMRIIFIVYAILHILYK